LRTVRLSRAISAGPLGSRADNREDSEISARAVEARYSDLMDEQPPRLCVLIADQSHALDLISAIVKQAACPVIADIASDEDSFVEKSARRGIFAYVKHGEQPDMERVIDTVLNRHQHVPVYWPPARRLSSAGRQRDPRRLGDSRLQVDGLSSSVLSSCASTRRTVTRTTGSPANTIVPSGIASRSPETGTVPGTRGTRCRR